MSICIWEQKKKPYGAVMAQKSEFDFRFKKDSMYVNQNFRALLAFKCSSFFSDQKYVFSTQDVFFFQALRNTLQCSDLFKGLNYCEKEWISSLNNY